MREQISSADGDLWQLKALFGLSDVVHNAIYAEVGKEVYRRGISEVLADNCVTDEEKKWLDKLASDLELSDDLKQRVRRMPGAGSPRRNMKMPNQNVEHYVSPGADAG